MSTGIAQPLSSLLSSSGNVEAAAANVEGFRLMENPPWIPSAAMDGLNPSTPTARHSECLVLRYIETIKEKKDIYIELKPANPSRNSPTITALAGYDPAWLHMAATAPQFALLINDLTGASTSLSQKELDLAGASLSPSAHFLDCSKDVVPYWKVAECGLRDAIKRLAVVEVSS